MTPLGIRKHQRIAIIGGGISGLTAGYLLGQKHDVTLYEAESREGLGVRSMTVKDIHGDDHWLDVPLRVCRENYYYNICRLYKHLGAETEKVRVSQTIMKSCKSVIFTMGTAVHNLRQFIPMLFSVRSWQTGFHCIKFLLLSKYHLYTMSDRLRTMTFGEYVNKYVQRSFFEEFIYPSCNIILSCSRASVEGYPAYIVLKVLLATSQPGGRSILKLSGGINTIIPLLVQPIRCLKFDTKISSVRYDTASDQVLITDNSGATLSYDQVVFATEAECIPYIVADMPPQDAAVFRYFRYESVDILVHSNTELALSTNKTFWSLLNIIHSRHRDVLPQISLLMNNFISAPLRENFIQTLNPSPELLAQATVINQTRMKRVIFDLRVEGTLRQLEALQGKNNMWFCGSYAVYGSNLLEEGLISSMHIARRFGVPIPWEEKEE